MVRRLIKIHIYEKEHGNRYIDVDNDKGEKK